MKSRRKTYISIAIAATTLLLLWSVLNWNKATVAVKVTERAEGIAETIARTQPESMAKDTVAKPSRPLRTRASGVVAKQKPLQQVETNVPVRSLPPLHAAGLPPCDSHRQEIIALHPVATVCKKAEYDWKADTIPVKKTGRFDRGIVNYRFMPKGQTLVGMDFSFWQFSSDNSKLLFTYLDNFTFDARTLSINPFLGYFYRDNQAIGIRWGYKKISGSLGNATFRIDDDVNFTLKDLGLREELYGCTLFHRSYIGLDAGKRFGLFNETSLSFGFGKSVFTRGAEETLKETNTRIMEARLGISPGLAVFIMENVSVECSIGIMGLKYRQEKQSNNLGENGQRHNSGANFKVNLFDLNLGLIISL